MRYHWSPLLQLSHLIRMIIYLPLINILHHHLLLLHLHLLLINLDQFQTNVNFTRIIINLLH